MKSDAECEKAQRETEGKKVNVHTELIRKAAAKEVRTHRRVGVAEERCAHTKLSTRLNFCCEAELNGFF